MMESKDYDELEEDNPSIVSSDSQHGVRRDNSRSIAMGGLIKGDGASSGVLQQGSALRSMANAHKKVSVLRSKVVVVGDPTAGKTALVQMFKSEGQTFSKSYLMTLGVELSVKALPVTGSNERRRVEMYMLDMGGQSVFNQRELGAQHLQNANMAVVVYDVGSRASFLACSKWLTVVRSENAGRSVPAVLVANKTDLRERGRAQVSKEEAQEYASKNGLTFMECSALRNQGITEMFQFITDAYSSKYDEAVSRVQDN